MEILSIQYLRGCAALMIVFYHLDLQLNRVGYEGYWPNFLSAGVDVFFVISGFIMWITTAKGMTTLEFRAGSGCLDRFPRTISGVLPGLLSLPHRGGTKGGRSPTGSHGTD